MRFLLHGNLSPSVKAAVERHGHKALLSAEVEIAPESDAAAIMMAAHVKQLDILTNDREFALFARTTALKFDRSIVYLQLAGEEIEHDDAIDRLFARYKAPKPRQMYTVTETRVKVLQLKSI